MRPPHFLPLTQIPVKFDALPLKKYDRKQLQFSAATAKVAGVFFFGGGLGHEDGIPLPTSFFKKKEEEKRRGNDGWTWKRLFPGMKFANIFLYLSQKNFWEAFL